MWLYTIFPHYVHPDFASKNFGTLAEEAKKYADHTLGETEWKYSQVEREAEAYGLHLIFNFQRLISCLKVTKDARLNGAIDEDVLSRARKLAQRGADPNTKGSYGSALTQRAKSGGLPSIFLSPPPAKSVRPISALLAPY